MNEFNHLINTLIIILTYGLKLIFLISDAQHVKNLIEMNSESIGDMIQTWNLCSDTTLNHHLS
jgi:hypothetical protein